MRMVRLKVYFAKHIIYPLLSLLKQGISSEKLSLTLALGISFGIMPFFGVSSAILTVLALIFHLNIVAIQLVNYGVYLIQMVLFVPFLELGNVIFGSSKCILNFENLFYMIKANFWGSISEIWQISFSGLLLWFIISIPLSISIYYFSKPFFYKHAQKINS